jgi:neutral amino acid transport system permease protein
MDFGIIFGNAFRASIGPEAAVFALAAIGLNLHYGFTGLLNFGMVGFMLVGAYGLGITVVTFGLSMWLGILVGLALAVLLALALGIPTLRLRADYFAITTIATAEILRLVVRSAPADDLTGSVFGLQGIAVRFYQLNPLPAGRHGIGVFSFPHTQLWALLVTWLLVAFFTLVIALLVRSPWGRVLKSIREDEDAARSLGKNVFAYKMQSLVVGGIIGGAAGIMFAIAPSAVNADAFRPQVTFFAYAILILGGAATRFGPVVGAVIFWFLIAGVQSFLRQAAGEGILPDFLTGSGAVGAVSIGLVGLGLMLLMIFRPQGIFGDKNEMRLDA